MYVELVEMISNANEFAVSFTPQTIDENSLNKLIDHLTNEFREPNGEAYEKPKKSTQLSARYTHALLYAHLNRIPITNEKLLADQKTIVQKAVHLCMGILRIATAKGWIQAAFSCMYLCQSLVQAAWYDQSPLLQLPHFTRALVNACKNQKKPIRTIDDLLSLSEGQRRAALKELSDSQYSDVLVVSEFIPSIRIEGISFRVLGQNAITPGSVITCQIKVVLEYHKTTDENDELVKGKEDFAVPEEDVETFEFDEDGELLEDKTKKLVDAPTPLPIHCPYYPSTKRPSWWFVLSNRNNTNLVAGPIRVNDLADKKTVTLQFSSPPKPMNVSLNLHIRSDSLIGEDISREVKFTVISQSELTTGNSDSEWEISGDEEGPKMSFDHE